MKALSNNRKSLREMLAALLPVLIGVKMAERGIDPLYAAAVATALIGVFSRGYRIIRAKAPWLAWLLGGDGAPPPGV